jgi:hypothetical protein
VESEIVKMRSLALVTLPGKPVTLKRSNDHISGEASVLSWLERPKLLVGRLLSKELSASAVKV